MQRDHGGPRLHVRPAERRPRFSFESRRRGPVLRGRHRTLHTPDDRGEFDRIAGRHRRPSVARLADVRTSHGAVSMTGGSSAARGSLALVALVALSTLADCTTAGGPSFTTIGVSVETVSAPTGP